MYGKLFESMFDGTLAEDWQALITFQQMIILSDADGVIDMTPVAVSRRTGIPIEHIEAGIKVLESEDPYSRSPDHHGKRIIRLDDHRPWGWFIVNHEKYKLIQNAETTRAQSRDRKRKQRAKENMPKSQDVTPCHAESRMSRHTDTDTYTYTELSDSNESEGNSKLPPCQHEKIIELYHEALPMLPRVREWNKTRRGYLQARWREPGKQDLNWWAEFFEYVGRSSFLTGQAKGRDGAPPFIANLEWLVRPTNAAKVLEGNYHRESAPC